MDPDTNYRDSMYRLIIGQLNYDGHKQLALDLSNSLGMEPPHPLSNKLFRLVSAARQDGDNADEEDKEVDMQMSLSPVVPSLDGLTIDGERGDYFQILGLPAHLHDNIFSVLDIEDRMAFAGVNKMLNMIESESKYYVESLAIVEMPFIGAPPNPFIEEDWKEYKHWIVYFENKSYSSDFIRRIAHNASIGTLLVELCGSGEFHREICNLIKEIDIGELILSFKNKEFEKDMMVESFVLELARPCKRLVISSENVTVETCHKLYKLLFDGSIKLRNFYCRIKKEKCNEFLKIIGITYRDGTLFSSKNIEAYKVDCDEDDEHWAIVDRFHVFDGNLEMILTTSIFEIREYGNFTLTHHETQESIEEAKRIVGVWGGRRIEIVSE